MTLLTDNPLISALIAIVLAQVVKVPLHYFRRGEWTLSLAFSSGGMPSSHSAAVASLAIAIGLRDGFGSTGFAVAAVVCMITMYDAAGVRRHAGLHASAINRLMESMGQRLASACGAERDRLKEMLGHRPIEVLAGAIFGAAIGAIFHWI